MAPPVNVVRLVGPHHFHGRPEGPRIRPDRTRPERSRATGFHRHSPAIHRPWGRPELSGPTRTGRANADCPPAACPSMPAGLWRCFPAPASRGVSGGGFRSRLSGRSPRVTSWMRDAAPGGGAPAIPPAEGRPLKAARRMAPAGGGGCGPKGIPPGGERIVPPGDSSFRKSVRGCCPEAAVSGFAMRGGPPIGWSHRWAGRRRSGMSGARLAARAGRTGNAACGAVLVQPPFSRR